MKENEIMENMKNLNDNELKDVAGGGFFDIVTVEDRVKMSSGKVCPTCGHAVGTIQVGNVYPAYYAIICEKCGDCIGHAALSSDLIKV